MIKPDANNGGEVFYFDMKDIVIKAMIENTLTEDQFLKVKEIYD